MPTSGSQLIKFPRRGTHHYNVLCSKNGLAGQAAATLTVKIF